MPNFVIGRTKYDNYIIQSLAHNPSQVMIDASNMVAIVHQTIDGVRSGLRKQRSEKKSCMIERVLVSYSNQHVME